MKVLHIGKKKILVTIILDLIINYLINIAYSLNSSIELIGNTINLCLDENFVKNTNDGIYILII